MADAAAPYAPGATSAATPRAFQEQLRDAHDSLASQANDGSAESAGRSKRAPAPRTANQDRDNGQATATVPAQVKTAPPPVLPLSLQIALPNSDDSDSADGSDANSAPPGGPTQLDAAAGQVNPQAAQAQTPPPASQALQADLSFALKLNPQLNPQPAGAVNQTAADHAGRPNGAAAGLTGSPAKSPASAVTPVKQSDNADAETNQDPAPQQQQPQAATISKAVAAFSAAEHPASSGPTTQAAPTPHVDAAAKALDATPTQTTAADSTAKAAGPLKDLSIQVGQTANDKVEVRVVDRAGELQVAVRAANPDLAQGLRQGLSDLTDRLEQNGFRAEAWRPSGSVSTVQSTGGAQQKSTQFQNDGSQSQSGGSQQGRQQNNQQQSQRPRWVQELEGSLAGNSGESYGNVTR